MVLAWAAWCVFHLVVTLFPPLSSGSPALPCPSFCTCGSENLATVECTLVSKNEWDKTCLGLKELFTSSSLSFDLKLTGNGHNGQGLFFPSLSCLTPLNSLTLSQASLTDLPSGAFHNVHLSSMLDLSSNNITGLPSPAFASLHAVQILNLSANHIVSLTNHTFKGLHRLKSLDLSYNRLSVLDVTSFAVLKNLEYLNLAFNYLAVFSSWHISKTINLRVLILQGNKLRYIDLDATDQSNSSVSSLTSLDISCNPIDCSCAVRDLLKRLQHGGQTLANSEATICQSPQLFQNMSILFVNETAMTCSKPRNVITYPSREKSVVFKDSINLECKSDGYPFPSVIWIMPWGETFSHSPASLLPPWRSPSQTVKSWRQYTEKNVDVSTTISVNEKDDLVISEFRGSIAGNFTCVVFNVVGNKSKSIHLMAASMIKAVYLRSLFIGGYTASGFLIFGFLVGFLKIVVIRLRHKMCFTVPIFSRAVSVKPILDTTSCHDSTGGRDDAIFFDFSSPSSEYFDPDIACKDSGWGQITNSPSEKRPILKIESLEEARHRLRYGVGRRVESMKRNVQSIRSSSSAYVQTIKESGSSAASRMKASMALGVETVKSHVQSFKELCGTGEMGMHTISMISVETDIDTNQQTNIVRQITYV